MNIKKRILAVAASCTMIFSALPAFTSAAGEREGISKDMQDKLTSYIEEYATTWYNAPIPCFSDASKIDPIWLAWAFTYQAGEDFGLHEIEFEGKDGDETWTYTDYYITRDELQQTARKYINPAIDISEADFSRMKKEDGSIFYWLKEVDGFGIATTGGNPYAADFQLKDAYKKDGKYYVEYLELNLHFNDEYEYTGGDIFIGNEKVGKLVNFREVSYEYEGQEAWKYEYDYKFYKPVAELPTTLYVLSETDNVDADGNPLFAIESKTLIPHAKTQSTTTSSKKTVPNTGDGGVFIAVALFIGVSGVAAVAARKKAEE